MIVGVNKFQLNEDESISYLEIDNEEVKNNQINNLKRLKVLEMSLKFRKF